jgi:hypothetical protein
MGCLSRSSRPARGLRLSRVPRCVQRGGPRAWEPSRLHTADRRWYGGVLSGNRLASLNCNCIQYWQVKCKVVAASNVAGLWVLLRS